MEVMNKGYGLLIEVMDRELQLSSWQARIARAQERAERRAERERMIAEGLEVGPEEEEDEYEVSDLFENKANYFKAGVFHSLYIDVSYCHKTAVDIQL